MRGRSPARPVLLATAALLAIAAAAATVTRGGAIDTPTLKAELHANEEYGIASRLPAELHACTALSGDHPIGFFVWLNRRTQCDAPRPAGTRSISITASYNAAFEQAPLAGWCGEGESDATRKAGLAGLEFAGLPSSSCLRSGEDGKPEVLVAAGGGRWTGPGLSPEEQATPYVLYHAWLRTSPRHLHADVATLRGILADTRITPPSPDQGEH